LKSYIQDLESPEEIAARRGYPLDLVRDIARKVDRNEYKRQQAAVGLKITSKAFGIGRKFPIAQAFQAGSAHPAPPARVALPESLGASGSVGATGAVGAGLVYPDEGRAPPGKP